MGEKMKALYKSKISTKENKMKQQATVELKNGAIEVRSIVVTVYFLLEDLLQTTRGAIAFHDLVSLCRDSKYHLQDGQKEYLIESGLLQQNGTVHSSIKNIVLSAVLGEGLNMELVLPVKPKEKGA